MTIYPFSQIAANITSRVEPSDTELDRYVGLEHLDPESLKLRRWGSPADVIGQKLRFWKGDIIYGKRRAYQRKLAVADFDGICSAHAMVLRAKPDVCLPEFLPFFLQSDLFHQRAMEISVGSLSPTINWGTLAVQEFPLPPVDEQRRIADLLWAADDTLQQWQNVSAKLDTLADSYRDSIYSSSLKYPTAKIKDVSVKVSKGESPNWQGFKYLDSGIRFITSENVLFGKFEPEPAKYISGDFHAKIQRSAVEKDDMLINIVGASIGRACLAPVGNANVNQAVCVVRLRPEVVLPEFALSCLLSKQAMRNLTSQSVNTARANLSLEMIREFEIPIPPISVQTEMMGKMGGITRTNDDCCLHIENTRSLIRQILNSELG